jgi:hypothetical protein
MKPLIRLVIILLSRSYALQNDICMAKVDWNEYILIDNDKFSLNLRQIVQKDHIATMALQMGKSLEKATLDGKEASPPSEGKLRGGEDSLAFTSVSIQPLKDSFSIKFNSSDDVWSESRTLQTFSSLEDLIDFLFINNFVASVELTQRSQAADYTQAKNKMQYLDRNGFIHRPIQFNSRRITPYELHRLHHPPADPRFNRKRGPNYQRPRECIRTKGIPRGRGRFPF